MRNQHQSHRDLFQKTVDNRAWCRKGQLLEIGVCSRNRRGKDESGLKRNIVKTPAPLSDLSENTLCVVPSRERCTSGHSHSHWQHRMLLLAGGRLAVLW